jgi:hypothetical protein
VTSAQLLTLLAHDLQPKTLLMSSAGDHVVQGWPGGIVTMYAVTIIVIVRTSCSAPMP